jgi:zinc transport system substrate-binding protein
VDPDNAGKYQQNAAALQARLDALTAEIEAEIAPVKGKGFIVFHDAYHYFEKRFGVQAAGSITVSPEVMPGAERIAAIKARVAELGATCVFAEPQFEPRLVEVVIEGTGARAGVLDPEGGSLTEGPELYFDLMRNLATSLRDCLARES